MSRLPSVVTDPVSLAQRAHPVAGVLLPEAVEFCFHVMGNRRSFFDEMRLLIKPHYFLTEEALLRALWECMCQLADQVSGPFTFETLSLAMRAYLVDNQHLLTPSQQATLFSPDSDGVLWTMTRGSYEDGHVIFARQLLTKFLTERMLVSPLRRILQAPDHPENFIDLLEQYQQHASRLAGLHDLPRVAVAPLRGAIPYTPALVYKRTGLDFLDGPLGGQVAGDCYGLIGPTGGGKTTLGVHMAVSGARVCYTDAALDHTEPEFVVYISVEESARKLQPRIWSAAFQIPLAKLRQMTDWNSLTTQANLETYEHRLVVATQQGLQCAVPSESERYDAEQPMLAKCFELLDFSGSQEFPNAGSGYINEVASALDRVQQLRRQRIRTVYIDYAGLLVERHFGVSDDRQMRLKLKRIGDDFHKMVAEKFGCAVWLLHQLRGEAGNSSPLKLMSHHDAGETKDFGNNLAVCACLGVADTTTGCRRLNFSKTRNNRNDGVPPVTLRINDSFAVMEDVSRTFMIDEASRRFVARNEARQVVGAQAAAIPNPPARPSANAASAQQLLGRPGVFQP